MADAHENNNLVRAHEQRMATLENWCGDLNKEVRTKASARQLWTGLSIAVVILGGLLAIIYGELQRNASLIVEVQLYQVQVMKELGLDPKYPYRK